MDITATSVKLRASLVEMKRVRKLLLAIFIFITIFDTYSEKCYGKAAYSLPSSIFPFIFVPPGHLAYERYCDVIGYASEAEKP